MTDEPAGWLIVSRKRRRLYWLRHVPGLRRWAWQRADTFPVSLTKTGAR